MLEELTAYKTFGSVDHLTEIARAIANSPCSMGDLFVIANSNSSVEIPRIEAAVSMLQELGFCTIVDNHIVGCPALDTVLDAQQASGIAIGLILLERMLDEGIISIAKVNFDLVVKRGFLLQRDISLRYSQMRNYLIDAKILIVDEERLLFNESSADILRKRAEASKDGMTPKQLMEKLERDKEAGAAAEAFVMEYERNRLGFPLATLIQQVSLVSVSAGYDIASFESVQSTQYDRFIEVKAVGSNGFFLSANELKAAKALGKRYCLYLVDLHKKNRSGYIPEIIADPSELFSESTDWRVTPESYHITRIF